MAIYIKGFDMKYALLSILLCGVISSTQADVILKDLFDFGGLGVGGSTDGQINGGFNIIGSDGTAVEDSGRGKATISNAPNGSQYGILSAGTVSMGGEPTLRTRWNITDSSLKNNAESLVFTWQLGTDLETSPSIALVLDVQNSEIYILSSGNTNGNEQIDVSFGATNDVFSVVTEFTLDRYNVAGSDDLKQRISNAPISFGDKWASSSPAMDNIYVGAYVNGKAANGLVVEFDSVTVETIPEPAVISLIGIFGAGIIFSRRIFGRKKGDPDA